MATLHVVPHTHWDREWYLPFQEMRIRLVHLIDLLLDLLERDPGFAHFTLDGQTVVLDDYLEIRPEQRTRIARYVAEGRLVVGPWTVLPDEFLVSPESFVRNLARGTRTASAFGARMDVGYVPDPFGHIGQLPQILRGFGIESAVFRRGLGDEPCELWWDGPDGSRVLVAYLRDGYGNAARLPAEPGPFAAVIRARASSLAPHSAVSHRLLLNGSDHHEPQPELPDLLRRVQVQGDTLVLSTLPTYLTAVRQQVEARRIELPVVKGELRDPKRHHLLPGVLSSRVWIKQRNDACERLLERWVEPFTAWAGALCGEPLLSPVWTGQLEIPRLRGAHALIDEAWRILLTCHPHDSICGCSVDAVHDEMRSRFDQVEQIGREIARQSLTALAESVDTRALGVRGARQALVVFNPSTGRRTERVRATIDLGAGLEAFELIDADGDVLPHTELRRVARDLGRLELEPQDARGLARSISDGRALGLAIEAAEVRIEEDDVAVELVVSERGQPDLDAVAAALAALEEALEKPSIKRVRVHARFSTRVDLEVWVPELPPHGYAALGVRAASAPVPVASRDAEHRISNEWLAVQAAPDGTVTLEDRRSGAEFRGLLRLRDEADRGDSYTFCPVDGARPIERTERGVEIRREVSPAAEVLEIRETLLVPKRLAPDRSRRADATVALRVRIRVTLARGVPRADVEVRVENRAEDHRLQLLFPVGEPVTEGLYDGHFEIVARATSRPRVNTADWQEQPRPEQPMRSFVAARPESGGPGLLVAARGLREASVSPRGTIAVTLLRCFGWLSRDDLSSRAGGAGPPLRTPGGQSLGPHAFRLSLVPFADDFDRATAEADAFQAMPTGIGTGLHGGALPPSSPLLETQGQGFRVTAVLPGGEPNSVVVRGVSLLRTPGEVRFRPLARPLAWERVRLDETPIAPLEPDADGWVRIGARPCEIVTVRLRYASDPRSRRLNGSGATLPSRTAADSR